MWGCLSATAGDGHDALGWIVCFGLAGCLVSALLGFGGACGVGGTWR